MSFSRTAVSVTGNLTLNNNQILNVSSTAQLFNGMCIYGTGIKADTVISSISGTTVTMSQTASASGTGVTITGQYITQTGTDADPSGLSAMTGVTTITSGTGTRLKSIYDLGTNQLRIQGTFTHDPDQHTIMSGLQMAIRFESGTYNYGIETVVNGKSSFSKGCGLELTYSGGIASNFPIQQTGGTFNWKGGIVRFGGAWSITNGSFIQKGDTSVAFNNNTGTQIQLRTILPPANMRYEKIKLAGVNQVFFWTTQTYGAISAALENGAIQTPAGLSATQSYDNFVFANNQAPADFYINQLSGANSTLSIVKNPDVVPRVSQLNTGAYGVVETRETLTFNVSDAGGVSAGNVVGYVKDSNNGARTNENQLTAYTSDQVYVATSTSGGVLSLGDILVNVQMRNPSATNTVKQDYRGNYGSTSVDFNVYLGGYEFNSAVTRQTLLGNGGKTVGWTLFSDTNVTLSRTAALALIGTKFSIDPATQTITALANATLSELYDVTKAYKYQGTAAAFETPVKDAQIYTGSRDRLTGYSGWNLVVPTGVALVKDNKFKELALTGIGRVTVSGSVDFPYRDADGLRVTVTGLDPNSFGITWFLRHRPTGGITWTNISGTGNTALILLSDGTYDVQVRAPGYDWASSTLDTAAALSLDMALRFQQANDETPQYLKAYNATVESIFQYDAQSLQVAVTNTTSAIITANFAELYRATQRIMHIPALVWQWSNPIRANAVSQTISIPTGNSISLYLTTNSNGHVQITCPVVHQDTGAAAYDRVRGNAAGYQIILGSPATAESAGLQAAIVADILAATLKANIVKVNNVTVTGTGQEGSEWGPAV